MTVDELLAMLPGALSAEGLSHVVHPEIEVRRSGNINVTLPSGSVPMPSQAGKQHQPYVCWRAYGAVPDWGSLNDSVER